MDMDTDLDDAHTDYTHPRTRPVPAGCAESEDDWRRGLQHDTPCGHLLAHNAMTQALTSGRPIQLMHTTTALDAIRASGQLYASSGCLLAALYCAPLTETPTGLRPHNLGAYLLRTKPHTQTLMIEIAPTVPASAKGIDYLRLGRVHLRAYLDHSSFLTQAEDLRLRGRALHQIRGAAPFLDVVLANATGRRTTPSTFVDQLAAAVRGLPFLGYVYFEVLSEYLMLHSTSAETKAFAEAGEMNNRLYKRLAFSAVSGMDKLFDLSRFHPDHQRLHDLIADIEPSLAPQRRSTPETASPTCSPLWPSTPARTRPPSPSKARTSTALPRPRRPCWGRHSSAKCAFCSAIRSSTSPSSRPRPFGPGTTGTTTRSRRRSTGSSPRARSGSTPPIPATARCGWRRPASGA